MSNADPGWLPPTGPPGPAWWPPPNPPIQQPRPVAYVFAIVLPLILIAVVAAPLGVIWARRSAAGMARPGVPNTSATEGGPGLGDPYYPQAGNSGYDVAKYQIVLNWDPGTATLRGTTTITATATQRLDSFYLDLAVPTEAIKVNGKPATFAKEGFADVRVQPADPVTIGSDFQVVVDYAGQPGEIRQGEVRAWSTTNEEWTVANEPESSAWWFPANDHPSDPALMDISIRVPAGMEAISVGRLESADTAAEPDFDTWHWISRQPMATYLNFLTIGQFEIRQGTEDGLPFVYAVTEQLPVKQRQEAFKVLVTSGDRIATLATMFGPYPFTEIGGVVPAFKFAFGGLETQTRPVYQSSAILNENYAPELINHELAHMWFGDNVTLREWNDIFNNEAYASWAQWGYNERVGGKKANDELNQTYEKYVDDAGFWQITMIDPGRQHLFDTVYVRGPMAIQALRNVIGDDAFFRLTRQWAQAPGSRSLEDWMAAAQSLTTIDLQPFFQAWIYAPTAPARTSENGFR